MFYSKRTHSIAEVLECIKLLAVCVCVWEIRGVQKYCRKLMPLRWEALALSWPISQFPSTNAKKNKVHIPRSWVFKARIPGKKTSLFREFCTPLNHHHGFYYNATPEATPTRPMARPPTPKSPATAADPLVFGGFAFLPFSLGPTGDCSCRH